MYRPCQSVICISMNVFYSCTCFHAILEHIYMCSKLFKTNFWIRHAYLYSNNRANWTFWDWQRERFAKASQSLLSPIPVLGRQFSIIKGWEDGQIVMSGNPCSTLWATKGLVTSWTVKSSFAPLKHMIGCWTRHRTTSVYIQRKVQERPLKVPKCLFSSLH